MADKAAEVIPEPVSNEVAEVKSDAETKDEKTPETPVTEPITNGSNTPESPKAEIPAAEEVAPVASPESDKTDIEAKPEPQPEPEQLPVNGLSLEETKSEDTETTKVEESKAEESPAESTETAPAIEIPVKKEVCVKQMPLIEPTPPPLPANPPPSSVASFAATTMAPDLTDASLANTAETAISTPPAVLDTKTDIAIEKLTDIQTDITNSKISVEVPTSITKTNDDNEIIKKADSSCNGTTDLLEKVEEPATNIISESTDNVVLHEETAAVSSEDNSEPKAVLNSEQNTLENVESTPESDLEISGKVAETAVPTTDLAVELNAPLPEPIDILPEPVTPMPEPTTLSSEVVEDLPPPPPADEEIDTKTVVTIDKIESTQHENHEVSEIVNCNHAEPEATENNGIDGTLNGNEETEHENIKNVKSKDSLGNVVETTECNGNIDDLENVTKEETSSPGQTEPAEESLPPSPSEAEGEAGAASSDSFPAPPSERTSPAASPQPQEPLPVSDKLADLIPEVPVVPELKTETVQASDAAAN